MAYKRKTDQPKKDHYSDTAKEIADIFIKALEEETLPGILALISLDTSSLSIQQTALSIKA